MTKTALSDCSYPESMAYNIRDDIDATITRLKVMIDEEASLRNALRALFDKRREEAIEQVRMANLHLHLVNQEEAAFCADVRHASTKIKEELGGSVTVGLLRANLAPQRPLSFELPSLPPIQVELGLKEDVRSRMSSPLHVNLLPRPNSMVLGAAYDTSLRPSTSPSPPCMPQKSSSIYSFAPPRSPAQSPPALSPIRSPVRYVCGINPIKSHAQPVLGPDGNPLPRSPAISNRRPPSDAPAPSLFKKKKGKGGGGSEDRAQQEAQAKDNQVPETKEEDAEPMAPEAEEAPLDMIDEEPKKAAETKTTEAKKKKGKGKKGAKDTDTKPTPNVLSLTKEAPPNLDANEPKLPGIDEDEESAAEDAGLDFFAAAVVKNKKGTILKPTPAAKRAAKSKKPNLLSMPTEDLTGEPFTSSFDNNPLDPLKSPERLTHALPGHDQDQSRPPRTRVRLTHRLDDTVPTKSPAKPMHELFDEPPRSPARSTRAFDPPRSPARSTHAFADEPTRSPARSIRGLVGDPARSPARSTRGPFDEPPRSPARSTHAFEPPRSPARSVPGLDDGPMPISSARSNRGLPSDAPPRSPARSTRGLGDTYLSLDGVGHSQRTPGKTQTSLPAFSLANYGFGIEQLKKSPARPVAALPMTFALGSGGFGTSPTTNTGFGFDAITDPMQTPAAVEETPASMDDLFADMMQDADIEDHNYNQNRFSTIDTLDRKAELWEPKNGTFHERRIPRNYALNDVEIVPHNGSKRTPQYESAPLPKKTPAYEVAALPLPKSARMMPGELPQHQSSGDTLGQESRSVFWHGQSMPSPAKSQTSSQARRAMEYDLDTPIGPYDQQDQGHGQDRFSTIDILDEKAELWEPKSGTFHERKLPRSYAHDDVETVPPLNVSPQNRPVHHQDTSFLGTATHSPPPASPSIGVRGPPNAYVDTRNFDDTSLGPIHSNEPNSFMVDRSGNPVRTPMRQSMPITASARSSTSAMLLPPVQPNDIPWATGKTTTSQLPRPDTMYESAPPIATTMPPTSTTWGYVRESGQSLAPLGPLSNGGLSFSVGGGMANQAAMYNLANTSPVSTGRAQPMPLPTFHQNQTPPGSTRSNIMQIPGTALSAVMGLPPPGSTRFNIMDVAPPGTGRSAVQPLPSQSQIMLAGMLSSEGPGPEIDKDPIIPSGGGPVGVGKKKKAVGKKKK